MNTFILLKNKISTKFLDKKSTDFRFFLKIELIHILIDFNIMINVFWISIFLFNFFLIKNIVDPLFTFCRKLFFFFLFDRIFLLFFHVTFVSKQWKISFQLLYIFMIWCLLLHNSINILFISFLLMFYCLLFWLVINIYLM